MQSRWSDLDRPPLSVAALRAALTQGPAAAWRRLDVVPETGSTNADLAAAAASGEPEGLVLIADHQNAGRGRLDRRWTEPPRSSVIVSVLLRPPVPAERLGWLPLLAGLAVTDALSRRCGLVARLKWPNDVLVPARGLPDDEPAKVCGILAEAVSPAAGDGFAVVLGAGINASQDAGELPVPTATSLRLAGAATTSREVVLRAYLRALADRYRAWVDAGGDPRAGGAGAPYREACATLGRRVEVRLPSGETLRGAAQEVDDHGRLVVLPDGPDATPRALAAGDVVHVRGTDPAAENA